MKRISLLVIALVAVIFMANSAQARKHHPGSRHKHHHTTSYCKKYPGKCIKSSPNKPKAYNKHEVCMDKKGNNNGHIETWERNKFGGPCK